MHIVASRHIRYHRVRLASTIRTLSDGDLPPTPLRKPQRVGVGALRSSCSGKTLDQLRPAGQAYYLQR